jgi:hypothetical protein
MREVQILFAFLLALAGCGTLGPSDRYSSNSETQLAYQTGATSAKLEYQAFKQSREWEMLARATEEAYTQGYSGNSCGERADGMLLCSLRRLQKPANYPRLSPQDEAQFRVADAFNRGVQDFVEHVRQQAQQDGYSCAQALICFRPYSSRFKGVTISN